MSIFSTPVRHRGIAYAAASLLFGLFPAAASAIEEGVPSVGFTLLGIPIEFIFFGLTLMGVAVFHRRTLEVTLTGLTLILAYKFLYTGFELLPHLAHEWHLLLNLFGLLIGFAMLARHFEDSGVPELLPGKADSCCWF